jgi:hypothetical protein
MPPQIHAEPRQGFQIGLNRKMKHKHDIDPRRQSFIARDPFVRMMGQVGGVSERSPGFTARRLDVLHLSLPGAARSGTPFGVRALVGLCSGGTAARNPRLPSDTPPGSPAPVSGGFLACAAEFDCHVQRLTDQKVCHHVVE